MKYLLITYCLLSQTLYAADQLQACDLALNACSALVQAQDAQAEHLKKAVTLLEDKDASSTPTTLEMKIIIFAAGVAGGFFLERAIVGH